MELRHLRYFLCLAEELHFGRAAKKLHIAQPPLSQQIRQLEEELGLQLFERTKRRVQLTAAGAVFANAMQAVMSQIEQGVQAAQQASRGELGQLVIGFVGSSAYNVLPSILQTFRARFPQVNLTLHELTTAQQQQWFKTGQIDVGLARPPILDDAIECRVLLRESLVVALPETHPLAKRRKVSQSELAKESFILFPRQASPGLYDHIIGLCQQAGFSPHVTQEAIQMQTSVSLAAAGMGIAIVPESLQNLRRTGVIYRPFKEPTPQAEIGAVWRKDGVSPVLQRFLDTIFEIY